MAEIEARIARLLERLGDAESLLGLVACGPAAAPAIASRLQGGPAESVYQGRVALCQALAALRRYDLLLEFLDSGPQPSDAVLAHSEAAVRDTAARLLQPAPTATARQRLLAVVGSHCLPGALETLNTWGVAEAVPAMLRCLGDDTARVAALAGLQRLAPNAVLVTAALAPAYYPSERRTRCDCLRLLSDRRLNLAQLGALLARCGDPDPEYAAMVCIALLPQPLPTPQLETVADATLLVAGAVPWWVGTDLEAALARAHNRLSAWWMRQAALVLQPAAGALLRRAGRLAPE